MLRHLRARSAVSAALLVSWAASSVRAEVKLPALVSDGMVLQQKAPLRIWGAASEGEAVRVSFRGQTASTTAKGGQWSVTLKPFEAGGPFELTVAGQNTVVVRDVWVGDVWVCSGQSNMEFALSRSFQSQADIDAPPDPMLRSFTVGRQLAATPQTEVSLGKWEAATPETRGRFSAVGFYFGRSLRQSRQIPIGLIHTSWGGTPAEAWTSRSALEKWGMPPSGFDALKEPSAEAKAQYEKDLKAWQDAGKPQGMFQDPGAAAQTQAWASPSLGVGDWQPFQVPGFWEKTGIIADGAIWFRREIQVPPGWAGRELELSLGPIDDLDTTYFNGTKVGGIGQETPNYWQAQRRYRVPASLVRGGRAVLAVRVWDLSGEGGIAGPATALWVAPVGAAPAERIALSGQWQFKPELTRPSMPAPPGLNQNLPSVLYNGMVAPLLPYAIKGATWYQGESNTGRAAEYQGLLSAMVQNWRRDWRSGEFPFLIVQLAPYLAISPEPRDSNWAALREAQVRVSESVPKVGVAVITDVGDEKDIHPTRKQPVGERLALAARKIAYGEKIAASGPVFRSLTASGGKLTLSFGEVGQGLEVRGDKLVGFAIAGADKKFVNADAQLEGNRVVVSSPAVPAPKFVRFGWADYPVVNLWNKDGLPAVPFRTDRP